MMTWAPGRERWHLEGAQATALAGAGPAGRRAALRELAAEALGVPTELAVVVHREGEAPRLAAPAGRRLHLSSASRDGLAVVAVGPVPVGIDVEMVEPGAEIPDRVLHPDEVAMLRGLDPGDRAQAFARLWTLKEAYLKALGAGFARDTRSFAVRFLDEARSTIDDPVIPGSRHRAETRRVGRHLASLVVLP